MKLSKSTVVVPLFTPALKTERVDLDRPLFLVILKIFPRRSMKWKWWKKFLFGMILYPLIKSNTLIKVHTLLDCVSQKFFWPLSLQRFKHLSQYGHTLQWDFGDGATDIDTLRVVNQDVKREISKILIEVHTYCRIIL